MSELLNTPITAILLAITVVISFMAFNNQEMIRKMMFNPYAVKHQNEKWRFFTHGFIHADITHLLVNMYVFYSFGTIVESTFRQLLGKTNGEVMFLLLYLGAILFAPLLAYKKHHDNPGYNSLGASGATSAILIVFMVMYPDAPLQLIFLPIPLPAIVFGLLFFIYESYMNKRGRTGVAHDAHLLGALFGLVFLLLIYPQAYTNLLKYIGGVFG